MTATDVRRAGRLARQLAISRGFTLDPRNGWEPTTGYAVARPGSVVVGAGAPFGDLVEAIGARVKDAEAQRCHVGGWLTDDGRAVLDLVDVIANGSHAFWLGQARDQGSVYDLGSGREIRTGGTGGLS